MDDIQFDLVAGLKVLALFVTLVVLWKLSSFAFQRLNRWLEGFAKGTLGSFLKERKWKIEAQVFADALFFLAESGLWIIRVFLLYIFGTGILLSIPLTATWSHYILEHLLFPLQWLGEKLAEVVPNLFFIAVIFILTFYVLKFVKFVFTNIGNEHIRFSGFHPEWAEITYKIVRVVLLMTALVICFPYIPGSDSPAFKGLSVFIGVLFSLGSSSVMGNMMSGLLMSYMRPFKVGDRVKIADTVGDVVSRDMLVTRIRTIKNVEITVPNSMVLSNHIVNYSAQASNEGVLLNTTVTIGYDTPWIQVHEALIEAGKRTENVDITRSPFVLQTALNDFHISYELNVWTHRPEKMAVIYSDLHRHIQIVFAERNLEIMSPNYHAIRDGNKVTTPDLKH